MRAIHFYILTLAGLCILHGGFAQCPFAVSLISTGHCLGDVLTVRTSFPLAQIGANPPLSIPLGQSVTLQLPVSGDISSYSWSPVTGLSGSHIADPVATPVESTVYTLTVETRNGCTATGTIALNVFSPIRIPSAFTPNGDGKNDVFYILGEPVGSRIEDFSIFNRWGQRVFQRTDVSSGDPAFGWNGYDNGVAAPLGAYVYRVIILQANGMSRLFTGTVILAR